jgi:tRNA (adenine22-N1)-methyltransferase
MVTGDYTHIWDCCCDHGFLGASLLSHKVAPNVHFVDIVPELITNVENKLQQFYQKAASHWQTHCIDVAKLPLHKYQGNHLVIIAGVGGDLMIHFINHIYQQHPDLKIDFLLCPVNQQYTLRETLIALKFSLKNEALVAENGRYYEVILTSTKCDESNLVNSGVSKPISPVGQDIWQATNTQQALVVKKYLEKTLNHYKRIQQGGTENVDHIINAYSRLI